MIGVFVATSGLAIGIFFAARWIAMTDPRRLPAWLPLSVMHSWSVGLFGLSSGYVFFVLPFLLLGHIKVALVSAVLTTALIALTARDVVGRIAADIARHRAEGRGLFGHHAECAGHVGPLRSGGASETL